MDGSTAAITALLVKWAKVISGLKRHHIHRAAVRGGYKTDKVRRPWNDPAEDEFLERNWHLMSGDEIAAALGRSFESVNLRRKRLGIGSYDGDEFTIRDLEEITKIDHRQWHDFIACGWLSARTRGRRKEATPITYVSLSALHSLLQGHPEIYDYGAAGKYARVTLELDKIAPPPVWKRVTCRSTAWSDKVRSTPMGRKVTHGRAEMHDVEHHFTLESCGAIGGTSFWARTYDLPQCPRCGCQVSRYSQLGLFTDLDPGNDEVIDIQARKLGLRWINGKVQDATGVEIEDRDILECLFGAGRRSAKGLKAFEKLVNAGLSMVGSEAVESSALLDNILSIELRPDQEEVFQAFVASGSMTAAQAMSFGKSTLGLMAMTRLAGRHLLLVDTVLNREQWVEKLASLCPQVVVTQHVKPRKVVVQVFDRAGVERCAIDIFSYMTRTKLEGAWVVGCFDEVHRLPAALAHRHAFAKTQYRIGMSATADLRCDGRGALVSKMTGALVGDDWREQMATGVVKRIPVKVMVVEDLEHKHEVVGELLRRHGSVVVMCEAIADGQELELRYGIPFIHSKTKNKLDIVRAARSMVLSRIGDAGLSIPHCEVTVDHSGLFGSRIQSLQRLGRLMHSDKGQYHCILMTHVERHERFAARVDAIISKGFEVTEEVVPRHTASVHSLLSPTLQQRVSAAVNPFMSLLGWRKEELNNAA